MMEYIPQDIQDMQENYPDDYQKWLDTQEPTIKEMDEAAEKQENEIVF